MTKKHRKNLSRREFIQEATKGALALSCLSFGLNESCSRQEKATDLREEVFQTGEKGRVIDLSRISTCSICLNHLSTDMAFEIIAATGYKKVDPHEKVHFQIFEDLVDPVELKATADKHGLQIANLATYVRGGTIWT